MPRRDTSCFNAARRLTAAIAEMGVAPRLYLLTRNAQPVGEGDRANPAHAVLWGLGRTLALEHPEIWGGVIDVDESVPDGLAARYVGERGHGADDEDQVVYRAGIRRVPRLHRGYPPSTAPAEFVQGQQPSGHRRDRQHRTAPDPAARRHGRRHHRRGVAQSRFAPRRVGRPPVGDRHDVGDGGRRCGGRVRDERAVRPLRRRPSTAGRHLSGGLRRRPGDVARHDERRRHRDVPAEARRGVAVAPAVAASPGAPVRAVLVDLRTDRLALAGALHGDDHLPGHLRLRAPSGRASGHRDQLGTVEVVDRQPIRGGTPGDSRLGSRADGRRGRHPGAAVAHRPRCPGPVDHRRRRLGRLATAYRTRAALHIVDDLLPTDSERATVRRRAAPSSGMRCAMPNRRGVASFWSIT